MVLDSVVKGASSSEMTMETAGEPCSLVAVRRRASVWRRFLRNRRAVIGAVVLIIFCLLALLAPVVAPYSAEHQKLVERLRPPGPGHLMGTDGLGRDVFSRAVYACRVSLPIGIAAMFVSMSVGVAIGLIAGYAGGVIDNALMRITDLLLAFPIFFLLLTVTALFGRGIGVLILMLGLTSWGSTARIVRGEVLCIKEEPYVEASRSIGSRDLRIILRTILPNTVAVILVAATLRVTLVILVEGGLSFLGLGVQAPTPSWGNMIAEGREFLRVAPWITLFPGLFLFCCTMSFNLVGDGLRDAFDPRMIER
jgi:peptide/nickel transport system permease protein